MTNWTSTRLRLPAPGLSLGLVALALLAAGCSTAASMRVDVEVYKGPLSKPFSQQWGEFKGILSEAHAAFSNTECILAHKNDFDNIKNSLLRLINRAKPACGNIDALICSSKGISKSERDYSELKGILTEAAEVSTRMKSKAIQWPSTLQVSGNASEAKEGKKINAMVAHYCTIASEYSNQISTRADLLALQLEQGDITSTLSYYLRDSKPTLFPYLKAWDEESVFSRDNERDAEAAKAFELLFADHYWSKINTVYASGQGEFQLALVKDDIGNWTLKSYANDPSELVQGYRNLTMEAIEESARLVARISSGGASSKLQEALEITSRLTAGRIGDDSAAPIDMAILHQDVVARIKAVEGNANAREEIKTILENYQRTLVALQAASLGGPGQAGAGQTPAKATSP